MNKLLSILALCIISFAVKAQQTTPADEAYGKVDKEDLELKACDFEKDANAEYLIDKADIYYDQKLNVVEDCHERVKIFNDKGIDHANIRISYFSAYNIESINDVQAETINLVDGKVEVTKLDKKLIYIQHINKYENEVVFALPNVKAGSILDYKYTWTSNRPDNIRTWNFQNTIPVRYGEFDTSIPEYFYFMPLTSAIVNYTQNTVSQGSGSFFYDGQAYNYSTQVTKRVVNNLPSVTEEPFMSSIADNTQHISFQLTTFKPPYGMLKNFADSWTTIGKKLVENEDFGRQLNRSLAGEDIIINKAKTLKTDDEKIAYLFNTVKSTMKWDGYDGWYVTDGTSEAWDKKTGNSTEINLILYRLLKKAGIANAMPMMVSTRKHGKVNPIYKFRDQFNRAVVYIPVDSAKKYILDASNRYNMVDETPYNLLNSSGLYINADQDLYDLVFLNTETPVRQSVFINAEIKPEGKINGTAKISCYGYDKVARVDRYETEGEKKYIDYLTGNDNDLKVSSLTMENVHTDSLPLIQDINFDLVLSGSDENYIYFNSNLFSSLHKNPFLSETRTSDIDFGYPRSLTINGIYKEPAGYKVDVLPKNINMSMPDKSITFRRIVGEQDGSVAIRYVLNYNNSIYFKEDYADLHEFFKQLMQMLNEQIVLKKS
jgi:hypothetical protein